MSFGDSQPNELDVTLLNSETRDSKQGKHLPKNSKQSRKAMKAKEDLIKKTHGIQTFSHEI